MESAVIIESALEEKKFILSEIELKTPLFFSRGNARETKFGFEATNVTKSPSKKTRLSITGPLSILNKATLLFANENSCLLERPRRELRFTEMRLPFIRVPYIETWVG